MRSLLTKIFGDYSNNIENNNNLAEEQTVADSALEAETKAWIGVDLDGTLAHYDGWRGNNHIGKPVPAMLARVQDWIAQGYKVKIFTARASVPALIPPIEKWLKKHGLEGLEITNLKDMDMIELWDDRSVQVVMNTGNPVRSPSFLSRPRVPLREECVLESETQAIVFPPKGSSLKGVS